MGTFANSEDPDEMQHYTALYCISSGSSLFAKLKTNLQGRQKYTIIQKILPLTP